MFKTVSEIRRENLRKIVKVNGWKYVELAERLGKKGSYVSMLLTKNYTKNPLSVFLTKLFPRLFGRKSNTDAYM